MGGVLTVRVVRLQRILPPPPPQASHNGCSGKRGMSPGTHLQGRQAGLGDPRGGCRTAPAEEGRSDGQHPTFLIANRDGPGRRLDGRLLHEGAGDRHGGGSGGDSRNLRNPKK